MAYMCKSATYLASNQINLGMQPFSPLVDIEAFKNIIISSAENDFLTVEAQHIRTVT